MKVVLTFNENGTIRFIDKPAVSGVLSHFGIKERLRASRIEPVNRLLRWLFYLIRDRSTDNSALAAFTRRWPCKWQVDLSLSGGPVLGPYRSRADALSAEVQWLEEHVL